MTVLDTSFLVDLERRVPGAVRTWQALMAGGARLRVPAAAWVEFLHILPPAARTKAEEELERHASFEPFSRELANLAVRLQHDLASQGRRAGWHDLQIACTAIHLGEDLVSSDAGFDAFAGLSRRGW